MAALGLQVVLVAVAALSLVRLGVRGWGDEERQLCVDRHNELRRSLPNVCRERAMRYDMGLEEEVKGYISQCLYEHESKGDRGENLAEFDGYWDNRTLILAGMDMWWNEIDLFNYNQSSCLTLDTCHFTQMAWHDTNRLGCYLQNCGERQLFFCYYEPGGNFQGEKAYYTQCETPCEEGLTLIDGLCYGDLPCKDTDSLCSYWADNEQCIEYPAWMEKNCPVSCGFC